MLDSLPDDVLVQIGITTARLCGTRDFLALSRTSRRLQSLLVDSEETVQKVLALGTTKIHDSLSLPTHESEASSSAATNQEWVTQNLQQLQVYEEQLENLTLQEETKILGIVGCSYSHQSTRDGSRQSSSSSTEIFDAHDLHRCLMAVAERLCTTIQLVDSATRRAHCDTATSTMAPPPLHIQKTKHYLHHDSYFCWQTVYRVLWRHLARKHERSQRSFDWISCCSFRSKSLYDERILIRSWTEESSESSRLPLVARTGPGWVEVFFKMNDLDANQRQPLDSFSEDLCR